MSAYVAFPAHLVEELLALLPPDERPVYTERFEPIVSDLVWVRADAEIAVDAAFRARGERYPSPALVSEVADALADFENDGIVRLVTESLLEAADTLVNERFSGREPETSKG